MLSIPTNRNLVVKREDKTQIILLDSLDNCRRVHVDIVALGFESEETSRIAYPTVQRMVDEIKKSTATRYVVKSILP